MGVAMQNRPALAAHPNELDRKRIERALRSRKRYRYVSPSVAPVTGGYRVESPCCSRNIDRDGGVIDVALLLHDPDSRHWRLFSKDHAGDDWRLHSTHERIAAALDALGEDPDRAFWQ
ncbi:MAG: hypothetical protein P4M07_11775 [Xanthobacteraceae bacterium]|nr:hypothetical protein [Xanthobacteraceae bacterium]